MPRAEYWNKDLEAISSEDLKQRQFERLSELMKHAYDHSDYYRVKWDTIGLNPNDILSIDDYYSKMPFMTKSQIIENQAEHPPYGRFIAEPFEHLNRFYYSPGPLLIPFTYNDYEAMIEQCATGLFICGARKEDVVDVTFNYHWVLAGTVLDAAFRKIGCNVVPGGVGNTKTHVQILKLARVTTLFAFPTFAKTLVQVAREMGIEPSKDLNVRLVIIAGEIRSEHDKADLAEAFGADVREIYATNEIGWVAAECEYGGGMHFYADNIFEIVDPQTCEQIPSNKSGEIVSVCFSRHAMPLIRYRTGDLTEGVNREPCQCGRSSPKIKRILGRVSDIPRIKGMFVAPRQVAEVIDKYEFLGRFQIIVDRPEIRDEITIRVEYLGDKKKGNIQEILVSELKDAIRITPKVDLVNKNAIPDDEAQVKDNRKL